ncbi:MAG: hypothetical protein AB1489_43030 [Acidobacteriota bacterium]
MEKNPVGTVIESILILFLAILGIATNAMSSSPKPKVEQAHVQGQGQCCVVVITINQVTKPTQSTESR